MTIEAPALARPIGARYDRQFYSGMAIAAAIVVWVGFSPTFFLRARFQPTLLPLYLQIHGALFTTWIALFIAQTALVAARRTDVHRKLGWVGAGLALVMVVVGTSAGILSMRDRLAAQGDEALSFLTTPLFSMAAFATLTGAAIRFRRDPQTHKRLMLLATISVLDAAVARLPFEILRSTAWVYIPATGLFLVAVVLYDFTSRGRVHAAYVWGSLLVILGQALRIPIGETETWKALARMIIGEPT